MKQEQKTLCIRFDGVSRIQPANVKSH